MSDIIRQTELDRAEANPSIISTLVGGASPVPPQAQQTAQNLSSQLYGSGFVSGGEAQREAALKSMFLADQQMDQKYNPLPVPSWYVPNPADTVKGYAGYVSGMGDVAQASTGAVGTSERAYQTAIASVLDKFISFAQMDEDRKDREEQRKQGKFENELAIAKLMGGWVTKPDGERVYVQRESTGGGTAGERAATQVLAQLRADVASGVPYYELGPRYSRDIPIWQIRSEYNKGPLAAKEGPAKETGQQETEWLYKPGAETQGLDQEAISAYVKAIDDGTISLDNVPQNYRAEVSKRIYGGNTPTESKPGLIQRILGR